MEAYLKLLLPWAGVSACRRRLVAPRREFRSAEAVSLALIGSSIRSKLPARWREKLGCSNHLSEIADWSLHLTSECSSFKPRNVLLLGYFRVPNTCCFYASEPRLPCSLYLCHDFQGRFSTRESIPHRSRGPALVLSRGVQYLQDHRRFNPSSALTSPESFTDTL